MIRLGLTGGIGAGKTTVAGLFAEKGAFVIEADQIVHDLLTSENFVLRQIVSYWGTSVQIPERSEIDREKLSEIVFNETGALNRLLNILYPPIKERLIQEMTMASRSGETVFLFDASQILEAGWENLFDMIILVRTRFDICKERLLKKGRWDLKQILLRKNFQWTDWIKIRYSDFLIDNSGPIWKTREEVDRLYKLLI